MLATLYEGLSHRSILPFYVLTRWYLHYRLLNICLAEIRLLYYIVDNISTIIFVHKPTTNIVMYLSFVI